MDCADTAAIARNSALFFIFPPDDSEWTVARQLVRRRPGPVEAGGPIVARLKLASKIVRKI